MPSNAQLTEELKEAREERDALRDFVFHAARSWKEEEKVWNQVETDLRAQAQVQIAEIIEQADEIRRLKAKVKKLKKKLKESS